jgi:hypothetical protein
MPARSRPLRWARSDGSNAHRMPRMDTASKKRKMRLVWPGKMGEVGSYTAREHDVEQNAE